MAQIKVETIRLKNNMVVDIRHCEPSDAELFVSFTEIIGQQTPFTRFSTGVKAKETDTMNEWRDDLERKHILHLGAFDPSAGMIGYLKFRQPYSEHFGFKHVGEFGVMLLTDVWGQGIGQILMKKMETYAASIGVERIEARVRQGNERGFAFFKSLGYEIEGVRRKSAKIDGQYVDELYIAKFL